MTDRIRVLVADDSAFVRRAVERMLAELPEVEVVGTAADGREAVAEALRLRPDVVVLDINMPAMGGLEAIRHIMADAPTAILVMSTQTRAGADVTLQALDLGAVDFIDKGSVGATINLHQLGPVLRQKILAVAGAGLPVPHPHPAPTKEEPGAYRSDRVVPGPFELVAIGASTGGPAALTEILPRLPADLRAGVVVAQHMPPGFTGPLAERLDRRARLAVREALDGDAITPGLALIAPGGSDTTVERDGGVLRVRVSAADPDVLHHPSVDALLASAAAAVGSRAIGVVLTGMGEDGAEGLARLHEAGGVTFAESSETAVIYGMPRAAAETADRILPLSAVARELAALCNPAPMAPEGGE